MNNKNESIVDLLSKLKIQLTTDELELEGKPLLKLIMNSFLKKNLWRGNLTNYLHLFAIDNDSTSLKNATFIYQWLMGGWFIYYWHKIV